MKRSLNVSAVCDGRVTRALSIPEECNNRSRWLSRQAIPPDCNRLLMLPRSGLARRVIPLRGRRWEGMFRWCRALRALDHRLGLWQAAGLPKPTWPTALSAQLRCSGGEAELRRQGRSQVQLGNEEAMPSPDRRTECDGYLTAPLRGARRLPAAPPPGVRRLPEKRL